MKTLTNAILKKISQLGSELEALGYDISIAPKTQAVEPSDKPKVFKKKINNNQAKGVIKSWAAARVLHERDGIPMREARRIIAENKKAEKAGVAPVEAKPARRGGTGSGQASYWRKISRIRAAALKETGQEITFTQARKIYSEKIKQRRAKAA